MTINAQTLHNLFRRKYVAGLVLIALLAGASLFVFFDQTSHQAGRAELVGLATTQKALSQRVAFYAHELGEVTGEEKAAIAADLRGAIAQMRQAHAVLSGAVESAPHIRRHLEAIREIYFNENEPLAQEVKAYLDSAERLLDDALTPAETASLISEIDLLGMHTIMQTHDVIARIITYDAEQAIIRTNAIQTTLMTLIIVLLIAESIFIFEPMGRKIGESVRRAETSERCAIEEARRARAADEAKTKFLRIMSHELRTPLNAVIGLTDLLKDTPLDDKQRLYTRYIEGAGRHMLSLANDVLTINQHAAGRLKITPAPANAATEIGAVVDLLRPKALKLGLRLDAEISDGADIICEIDVPRLNQVLYNLIGNAMKFTPEGSVTVIADARPSQQDGFIDLEIRVRDTGIGVPEEKQDKIFEEFEQVHRLGKRSHSGAGLGLAISRRIIEAMGGALTLESSGPQGSTFLAALTLKRAETAPATHAPKTAGQPAAAPAGAVLVVDDNLPNRMIAGAFLTKAGCEVVYAENGKEALDIWEKTDSISMIFMDIEMPVMDGLEATRELRARQTNGARTPVIALTAHALPEDTENLLESGFDAVLRKPTSEQDLVDCMRRFGAQKQAA